MDKQRDTNKDELVYLNKYDKIIAASRFMIKRSCSCGFKECVVVPEKQMEDFIRVVNSNNENIEMLRNSEFLLKPGSNVIIKSGELKGVKGIIKRLKRNKQIVMSVGEIITLILGPLNTFDFEIIKKVTNE